MIPKRLYTTWIGTPDPDFYKPHHLEMFLRCFESWRRVMPDYSVTVITRENVFDYDHNPIVQEWYDRGFMIINWATPQWLYELGGIYIDMDVEVMRRFDELLTDKCFVGRESDGFVNPAVVGAVANHPFMDAVRRRALTCDPEQQNEGGPRLYTRLLCALGWDGSNRKQTVKDVTIYPNETFFPYLWNERFTPSCVKLGTLAVHHWASSWQPKVAV